MESTDLISGAANAAGTASRSALREYIVEVLGSLAPGGAFLIALAPAVIIPVVSICADLFPPTPFSQFVSTFAATTHSTASIVVASLSVFSVCFLFSYVAGQLFYRQDPKYPDAASFHTIPREEHHDGMVRPEKEGKIRVEFPYHFLKLYLKDRGFDYLADKVPWNPTDKSDNINRRSKHWINALKVRIGIASPAHIATLARNEAHVRLASSMWYVCRAIVTASWIGFALLIVTLGLTYAIPSSPKFIFSPVFFFPVFSFVTALGARRAIEHTLHYQRAREVFMILETAHWLSRTKAGLNLFDGLEN